MMISHDVVKISLFSYFLHGSVERLIKIWSIKVWPKYSIIIFIFLCHIDSTLPAWINLVSLDKYWWAPFFLEIIEWKNPNENEEKRRWRKNQLFTLKCYNRDFYSVWKLNLRWINIYINCRRNYQYLFERKGKYTGDWKLGQFLFLWKTKETF